MVCDARNYGAQGPPSFTEDFLSGARQVLFDHGRNQNASDKLT